MLKEYLVKTSVERANLRWSVNDFVAKMREAFFDLGKALQAVVENSNRSSEDVADRAKAKMGQAGRRLLPSPDME